MTFPMENREQGSERVSGVPRLFAVLLRLGLVNAPTGDDVTDAQLLLCRGEILRPQMYQRNLNPCDAQRPVSVINSRE
jgi:hypothetical protein